LSVQLGQVDLVDQIKSAAGGAGGTLVKRPSIINLNQLTSGSVPGVDLTPDITNVNVNAASAELAELNEFLNMIKTKITNLLAPSINLAPSLRLPAGETQLQLAADIQSIQSKIAIALALLALMQLLKSSGSGKSVAEAQAEQAEQAAQAQANTTTNTLISSTTTEFFNTSVT
jgi:hypothetical protein